MVQSLANDGSSWASICDVVHTDLKTMQSIDLIMKNV